MTDFCQTCGRQKGLHFSVLPACTCTTAAPFYYPIQPKREWVGLTDEEIEDLIYLYQKIDASNSPYFYRRGFARAIEVKLRERNT